MSEHCARADGTGGRGGKGKSKAQGEGESRGGGGGRGKVRIHNRHPEQINILMRSMTNINMGNHKQLLEEFGGHLWVIYFDMGTYELRSTMA